LTSFTASSLNSRVNFRLSMTHLLLHKTPNLVSSEPGAAQPNRFPLWRVRDHSQFHREARFAAILKARELKNEKLLQLAYLHFCYEELRIGHAPPFWPLIELQGFFEGDAVN
jgi:hypothetical protein